MIYNRFYTCLNISGVTSKNVCPGYGCVISNIFDHVWAHIFPKMWAGKGACRLILSGP